MLRLHPLSIQHTPTIDIITLSPSLAINPRRPNQTLMNSATKPDLPPAPSIIPRSSPLPTQIPKVGDITPYLTLSPVSPTPALSHLQPYPILSPPPSPMPSNHSLGPGPSISSPPPPGARYVCCCCCTLRFCSRRLMM